MKFGVLLFGHVHITEAPKFARVHEKSSLSTYGQLLT